MVDGPRRAARSKRLLSSVVVFGQLVMFMFMFMLAVVNECSLFDAAIVGVVGVGVAASPPPPPLLLHLVILLLLLPLLHFEKIPNEKP